MRKQRLSFIYTLVGMAAALVVLAAAGCASLSTAPATPTVLYHDVTYGQITPGPHKNLPDLSTVIEVPPFPYSAPLPPAVPSVLDGLYARLIPSEGTPTPCKRCAGYRVEGGVWTLYFDKGVFKVFQQDSGFEAVGSFSVSGDRLSVFNDPYCEEDTTMVGHYSWRTDGNGALVLTALDDPCSIGLRAKNLTLGTWTQAPPTEQARAAACQPPNREAAVTDHWKKPPYCR
jgi:hypothetical protein